MPLLHLYIYVKEMAYAWNGLVMLKCNNGLRNKLLELIQDEQNDLEKRKGSPEKGRYKNVSGIKHLNSEPLICTLVNNF